MLGTKQAIRTEGVMMLGAKQAIRTEGVMMLGAKRVVLAPSVNIRIDRPSGWTKAQPYEKELLPPEIVPRPDPGRMEGIMMLGAKQATRTEGVYLPPHTPIVPASSPST